MSYCTQQDLVDRLSAVGLAYLADDDDDGEVSGSDEERLLDAVISAADAEIDLALAPHVELPVASNDWLRDRAVDLASERLAERKGHAVPTGLWTAAARSRRWLDAARRGELRVPGLVYATDGDEEWKHAVGQPRVVNPTVPEL